MLRAVLSGTVAIFVLVVLVGAGLPVAAQTRDLSRVQVLAVAAFADDNPLTRSLAEAAAIRLSDLLRGGRFRVIEAARVADAAKRLGVTPRELISPSQAVSLGAELGADAILTGRVIAITRDRGLPLTAAEVRATVDVRVLAVATRTKLFEEEVTCSVFGVPLEGAVECMAQEIAARLAGR